jgi:hypothetical protein
MVNWQDPEVIESWNAALVDITLVILGLYGCVPPKYSTQAHRNRYMERWSYIHSCQVESALLRRQLPFRWRMVSIL